MMYGLQEEVGSFSFQFLHELSFQGPEMSWGRACPGVFCQPNYVANPHESKGSFFLSFDFKLGSKALGWCKNK